MLASINGIQYFEVKCLHLAIYHYGIFGGGTPATPVLSAYGANASMIVYTMVEMAKAHGLHPYNYLQYLLDSRPGPNTTDAEFENLAPWSEKARIECNKKSE